SVIPDTRVVGLSETEQLERLKIAHEQRAAAMEKLRPDLYRYEKRFRSRELSDQQKQEEIATLLWRQQGLITLSELCGGWTDFLEQPEQAADLYARILSDINRRYIIGYQPANQEHDGKLRNVTVEIRGHPEYIVWGRKSYFAPTP